MDHGLIGSAVCCRRRAWVRLYSRGNRVWSRKVMAMIKGMTLAVDWAWRSLIKMRKMILRILRGFRFAHPRSTCLILSAASKNWSTKTSKIRPDKLRLVIQSSVVWSRQVSLVPDPWAPTSYSNPQLVKMITRSTNQAIWTKLLSSASSIWILYNLHRPRTKEALWKRITRSSIVWDMGIRCPIWRWASRRDSVKN